MRLHHGLLVAAALAAPSFALGQDTAPATPAATAPAASVPTTTTRTYTTAPMVGRRMRGQTVMMGQPVAPTRYTVARPAGMRARRTGLLSRLGLRRNMRYTAGR